MRPVLVMAMLGGLLAASPARADFAKGQELVLLTAHSAVLAAQHCPYQLDERRLQAFLSRKGLKRADLDSGSFSPLLQEDMAADDARYGSDNRRGLRPGLGLVRARQSGERAVAQEVMAMADGRALRSALLLSGAPVV